MRRFSFVQIVLLLLGTALIATSFFLNQLSLLWQLMPGTEVVNWNRLQILPGEGQQVAAIDADYLVLTSAHAPGARLTLFVRPEDGRTPEALVKSLCRRDACTHSASLPDGSNTDVDRAVATYRLAGAPLALILMRPGASQFWIEYKGSPLHYAEFRNVIDSVSDQLKAAPVLEEAQDLRAAPSA
ncbi:MAG TPA: hypothetical protein VMP00_01410 [Burkholderiales bacterium]|nr:hypothetical protein [Burkholderiales bacterium]